MSDYSQPQYQSKKGILLLAALSFGKFIRNFWFIIILFFYKNGISSVLLLISAGVALLILVLFNAYFRYHYFTYHLDFENESFIIQKGIINKKTILLEKNKIQEVNINQPFLHRLLHIYQLEIDSPGTDKKEITIDALSYKNAEYLKQYLLSNANVIATEIFTTEDESAPHSYKISLLSIIKYAISANYLKSFAALLAFVYYMFQNISDRLNFDVKEYIQNTATEKNIALLSFFTVLVAFLALIMVAVIINVVRTVFVYYNLEITMFKKHFSLQYGLLNTKNQIINRSKVQIAQITQNYFQKKADVLLLKLSQIGEDQLNSNTTTLPGCNEKEKSQLLYFIFGEMPLFKEEVSLNFRFLLSRGFIFIALPFAAFLIFSQNYLSTLPFILIYSIFAALYIYFYYKNSRLSFNEELIKKEEGFWDVEQKIFEIEKIQAVQISQYFWQKRTGLGNIQFTTAGGSIKMKTSAISQLKKLMNYTLYKVESSSKNWM